MFEKIRASILSMRVYTICLVSAALLALWVVTCIIVPTIIISEGNHWENNNAEYIQSGAEIEQIYALVDYYEIIYAEYNINK